MKLKVNRITLALREALYPRVMRYAEWIGAAKFGLPFSLPDKAAVEKLPEAVRSNYVERDGKWMLDLDGGPESGGGDSAKLQAALEKERRERRESEKKYKEQLKAFEGIDPDGVRELLTHFENKEDAELIKQGAAGIEKIVERKIAKAREAWEREKQKLVEERDGAIEGMGSYMQRVLDFEVMSAATKAGIHQHAVEDVLLAARQLFDVDEEGRAVQFDKDNPEQIVMGKDGKTPYQPSEWIESMREKRPHWFPVNGSGGGSQGGGQNYGGKKTMKRAEFDQLAQNDPAKAREFTKEGVIID